MTTQQKTEKTEIIEVHQAKTADPQPETLVQRLHDGFQNPDPSARPMMRWWWFGPQVDRDDLARDLDQMAAAGIGGVECSFVYPMSAQSDRFLSETFLADVGFAAEAAEQRGLRFDVTLGSGWPYGGPHIDETTASRRIHWEREEVRMHAQKLPVPRAWPHDEFIAAYIGEGTQADAPEEFVQLETELVGEVAHIVVPAGRGPRVLLAAISRPTGQTLKRAAAGAEGWALDHLSRTAADTHIAAVAEPLIAAAGAERIRTVFCDSLEVYDADWTPHMPQEFTSRRGYDLLPHLWKLTTTSDAHRGLRADFFRTVTELLEDNFIAVMAGWAQSKKLVFRIQGYGEPPATVSSYRHAHAFEGEGWGWDTVTACRWASSAGQIYDKQIISSETWTWNHSPSFRSTPLDILGEAHDHLLMGINQFVGHGWPTSPRPPQQPGRPAELGRVFYASGALDDRNAWWDAAPALWGTLHRLSWLMRQGTRLSQVGVYVPARDIYAKFAQAGRFDLFKETRKQMGQALPSSVRTAGLDFDLFDDDAVNVIDPQRFPVVVLPWAIDVPASTRAWLEAVADAGGTVLDLGGTAGIGEVTDDPYAVPEYAPAHSGVSLAIHEPDSADPQCNRSVAVTSRELTSEVNQEVVRVHFVANAEAAAVSATLNFTGPQQPKTLERWDAETGRVIEAHPGARQLVLPLEGYEAAVVIEHSGRPVSASEAVTTAVKVTSPAADDEVVQLDDWSVQFPDEPQPRSVTLPHRWEDEEARRLYSGRAAYTSRLRVSQETKKTVLDLGQTTPHQLEDPEAAGLMEASFSAAVTTPVGAVAVVLVDGHRAGVIWKTPYRLDISNWVIPGGDHEITLWVSNVTSHRLAVDQGLPKLVEQAQTHFGRRFGIQTLELALADVASGLLATPQVRCTPHAV